MWKREFDRAFPFLENKLTAKGPGAVSVVDGISVIDPPLMARYQQIYVQRSSSARILQIALCGSGEFGGTFVIQRLWRVQALRPGKIKWDVSGAGLVLGSGNCET